jgi:hypothetical protein
MMFFSMFNFLEAVIEEVFFGERFVHILDPFFILLFIVYAAYVVWWCACLNQINLEKE